jgi:hypothetical protein
VRPGCAGDFVKVSYILPESLPRGVTNWPSLAGNHSLTYWLAGAFDDGQADIGVE